MKGSIMTNTLERLPLLGRKFDVEDVTEDLVDLACEFLGETESRFGFIIEMKRTLIDRGDLTPGQTKGVLNCMIRDAKAAQAGPVVNDRVEDGFYEADNGRIVKVQTAVHGSGRQYAKLLDTEDGSFDYAGRGPLAWGLTPLTLERAQELGQLYGVCMRCGRTLTDEGSIAAGIGPVCAGKW